MPLKADRFSSTVFDSFCFSARRFVMHALPRARSRIEQVLSQERSTLDAYDSIVGPLIQEEE